MEQNRRLQQPQRGHRVGDYSVARQLLYSPGVSEKVLPLSGGSGSSGVSKKRHRRWHTQLIGSRKSTGYGSPVCLSTKQNEYSEGEAGADGEHRVAVAQRLENVYALVRHVRVQHAEEELWPRLNRVQGDESAEAVRDDQRARVRQARLVRRQLGEEPLGWPDCRRGLRRQS
ncbi:hypothetical protein CRV24_005849 [Beauveria bassiana]|nr:hypothetical protein CRV24_005849 [Beauveria bassiana]KAH8709187.1 hypothetical protein HC256_009110 [Beauveria bassiana]